MNIIEIRLKLLSDVSLNKIILIFCLLKLFYNKIGDLNGVFVFLILFCFYCFKLKRIIFKSIVIWVF